jgi:hypothetical protein
LIFRLIKNYLIIIAGHPIETNAASIGIPAPIISVRYRSTQVPDWVTLFGYWKDSGIGIFSFWYRWKNLVTQVKKSIFSNKFVENSEVDVGIKEVCSPSGKN